MSPNANPPRPVPSLRALAEIVAAARADKGEDEVRICFQAAERIRSLLQSESR
jgi:hypothetical protein